MSRKLLAIKLLGLAMVAFAGLAFTTADASAWGWSSGHSCCGSTWFPRWHCHHCGTGYNAFTPRPVCYVPRCGLWRGACCRARCAPACHTAHRGLFHGHSHRCAPSCTTSCGSNDCCFAQPVMSQTQMAQDMDPTLMPFVGEMPAQVAMQMPMQMPMQMQPVAYPAAYPMAAPMTYPAGYAMPYSVPYTNSFGASYGVQPAGYMPYYPANPYPVYPSYGYSYPYGY